MYIKICEKCGKKFETEIIHRRFCCKSCSNSFNTSLRMVPDENIFKSGLNEINAYILGIIYSDGCLFFDKKSIEKFYFWMYTDANLYLSRKKRIFIDMI